MRRKRLKSFRGATLLLTQVIEKGASKEVRYEKVLLHWSQPGVEESLQHEGLED